jgi:hypothetical protein
MAAFAVMSVLNRAQTGQTSHSTIVQRGLLGQANVRWPWPTPGPEDITCPAYLLAGEADDITTRKRFLMPKKYLGRAKDKIVRQLLS